MESLLFISLSCLYEYHTVVIIILFKFMYVKSIKPITQRKIVGLYNLLWITLLFGIWGYLRRIWKNKGRKKKILWACFYQGILGLICSASFYFLHPSLTTFDQFISTLVIWGTKILSVSFIANFSFQNFS